MNKLTLVLLSLSLPFLPACTPSMPTLPDMPNLLPDMSLPTLYKDDVQQGSVLTRFKINQLRVGMSKAQVQDLIGSPSIIDPFHSNQWDYINHTTRHERSDIHYRLALKFTQDKLATIDSSGIVSLDKMTDKEKALEEKRLIVEKAKIEAERQAKIKAEKLKKAQAAKRIKDEKLAAEKLAIANAQEAKRIEDEKLAIEKAKAQVKAAAEAEAEALKNSIKLEQAKQQEIEALKVIKTQQPKQETLIKKEQQSIKTPWYKFWLD
ncbi:outer membrane protein assembly factor BamE [Candidatus Thioglobus sp.]|nr:outer membrane protein assembly factor BamE [Candidatus Thioglobus sp.]